MAPKTKKPAPKARKRGEKRIPPRSNIRPAKTDMIGGILAHIFSDMLNAGQEVKIEGGPTAEMHIGNADSDRARRIVLSEFAEHARRAEPKPPANQIGGIFCEFINALAAVRAGVENAVTSLTVTAKRAGVPWPPLDDDHATDRPPVGSDASAYELMWAEIHAIQNQLTLLRQVTGALANLTA